MDGIKSAAAGTEHSLVLKTDGSVWAFGANSHWQTGTSGGEWEMHIELDPSAKGIAVGSYHTLIIDADGTLRSLGWNESGQLGNGKTDDEIMPQVVATGE